MPRNVHKEEVAIHKLPRDAVQEDRGVKTCGVPQLVLADILDVTSYKNDRTAIADKFDSMIIELEDRNGVITLAPGVSVGFPYQPDAAGFIVDWRQVVNSLTGALAEGCYKIRVNWTLAGNSGWYYKGAYNLLKFNPFNARNTVRLYVVLNDLVTKQGINYKDSGFAGTVRFEGMFGFMQPNYDVENNIHVDNERFKVSINSIRTYELHTSQLPICSTRLIDEETLLVANQIYVTDHNANNHNPEIFDFPVIIKEGESPVFEYNKGIYAKISVTFVDKKALYESKYDGNIASSDNAILQLPTTVASCPSSVITLDSAPFLNVLSGSTTDANLVDQNGNTITPLSISSGTIEVVIPPKITIPPKTGQTSPTTSGYDGNLQQGRGVDFFTLSENNPFGNSTRFTGTTGTSTIQPDGIMIDWEHKDDSLEIVHGWNTTPISSLGVDADITAASLLSFGGISVWQLPNIGQLETLKNSGVSTCTNWSPLSVSSIILKSNTIDINNTTKARIMIPATHSISSENKAFGNPRKFLPFRYITYTELGI